MRTNSFHRVFQASLAATALLFALPLPQATAGTLTKLRSIGANSSTELVKANDGNLYSVTDGYFYKITPTGTYTAITSWSLQPPNCLIKGSDGNIYGTVPTGGAYGSGVVFQATLSGTISIIAEFDGSSSYGGTPGNLVQGSGGELFGTTSSGGDYGYGTIFKLESDTSWTLTSMVSFSSWAGTDPSSLIQGSDGSLYVTCKEGGSYGEGTIFQYWPMDSYPNLLGEFGQYPQWYGAEPVYMIETDPGVFVGMTNRGGYFDRGLLFYYTSSAGITGYIDLGDVDTGYLPNGKAVDGGDGWFYGTMATGGDTSYSESGEGTLYRFKFDLDTYSYDYQQMVLFKEGTSCGGSPMAPLATDGSGHFYGTTSSLLNSSIFKFTP